MLHKPLLVLEPVFRAIPNIDEKYDYAFHYVMTYRRNPALVTIPDDHPQLKDLESFAFRWSRSSGFTRRFRTAVGRITGADARIREAEAYFDHHVIEREKARIAAEGEDPRCGELRRLREALGEAVRRYREAVHASDPETRREASRRAIWCDLLEARFHDLYFDDAAHRHHVRVLDRRLRRDGSGEHVLAESGFETELTLFDADVRRLGLSRAAARALHLECAE